MKITRWPVRKNGVHFPQGSDRTKGVGQTAPFRFSVVVSRFECTEITLVEISNLRIDLDFGGGPRAARFFRSRLVAKRRRRCTPTSGACRAEAIATQMDRTTVSIQAIPWGTKLGQGELGVIAKHDETPLHLTRVAPGGTWCPSITGARCRPLRRRRPGNRPAC